MAPSPQARCRQHHWPGDHHRRSRGQHLRRRPHAQRRHRCCLHRRTRRRQRALAISGNTIDVSLLSTISGLTVSLTDTAGISIAAAVTGTNGVTSIGSGTFTLAVAGSIVTTNSPVTITHASGLVNINGLINAGTGKVQITGLGVSTGAAAPSPVGRFPSPAERQTSPSPD